MKNLEKLYEIDFDKISPLQRKIEIKNTHTIIVGAPKSGKSYLIYDHLKQYLSKQYLYINLDDLRFDTTTIFYNLDRFLIQNKDIEILALDNCHLLPTNLFKNIVHLKSIIISSLHNISLKDFKTIHIKPLDFEEYISFDIKHQNITNSFNSFLKYGNFPEIIQINENKKMSRNQEIIQLITNGKLEFEILKLFISATNELKSIFQLFNYFKRSSKISKDIFYQTAKMFESKKILYFCHKYKEQKAPKKIYCYNHSLINAVTIDKKFNNLFSNMIFLELGRLYKNIYYLDYIDFYIDQTNSIILSIPFFNDHSLLSAKILPTMTQYNISKITIITVSIEKTIFIDSIECKVLPFYSWALSL
ncbi:conserved hypothetical protein-Uncharacterized ATPase [hydrothermal vent metagenome]|uniref:AAA domain-containing protein n=1 Tax=hydrothermal vent metagenome TaxID=652676 RepID=A0A3B1E581_9ZZZZ